MDKGKRPETPIRETISYPPLNRHALLGSKSAIAFESRSDVMQVDVDFSPRSEVEKPRRVATFALQCRGEILKSARRLEASIFARP